MKSLSKSPIPAPRLPGEGSAMVPVEYLPPANSIDERAQRVGAYYHSGKRAAAQLVVYNVLAGLELIGIKTQIGHGAWLKWCDQNLPDGMSQRSATYFMGLAEALIPKLSALTDFDFKPLQLTNGELGPDQIKPFAEAVREITNGKAYTDLLREYGLMADPIHQKDRSHTPPSKPTAEDQKKLNLEITHRLANDARAWRQAPSVHKDCDTADLNMLLDELVQTTNHIRALKKTRGKLRGSARAPRAAAGAAPAAPKQMSKSARAKLAANARARWAKLRTQQQKEKENAK